MKKLFSTKRLVIAALLVAVLGAGAAATYFVSESRAKEKRATRGPAAIPVSVEPAQQRSVPVRLQAIGNVEPYLTVAVKARVDGQIVAVNFREGQEVRKGEALIRIDPRPYEAALRQAEAAALRDAASRQHARNQEQRYKELLEKNFVSKDAYAQFATNADTADATLRASEAALENARLNLEYCTIFSPIDGFVGRALLQVGNMVKANDINALVVINQVKPIYVSFAVPEQTLASIRSHMAGGALAVEAVLAGAAQGVPPGKLVFVDNAVDPSTGTIKLRAQFDNRDAALWPGQFVNVSLRLFEEANAILVPSRALQTGPEGQYVFVVKPDLTAEVRKVAVERAEGEQAVVKGVAPGEQVVTRGALRLSPGARVEIRAAQDAAS